MSHFSRRKERGEHYVFVERDRVLVGEHDGTGHSDYSVACSHAEFLAGRFQDEIRRDLGPAILRKVLAAVKKAAGPG